MMRFSKQDPRENGFTLVEVLIAFLIFSLSLTVLYQSFTTSWRGTERALRQSEAVHLGEALLERVGVDIPLTASEQEGAFEAGDYSWRLAITPSDLVKGDDRRRRGLYPYDVEVAILDSNKVHTYLTLHVVKLGAE